MSKFDIPVDCLILSLLATKPAHKTKIAIASQDARTEGRSHGVRISETNAVRGARGINWKQKHLPASASRGHTLA